MKVVINSHRVSSPFKCETVGLTLRAPKGLPPLSVYAKTGYYAPNL